MNDELEAVLQLIEGMQVMTIASADAKGKPWVSPVAYAIDSDFNFYWVSDVEALHSVNVRGRGTVALSIWDVIDGRTVGLYVDALAHEAQSDEVERGSAALARRKQPTKFTIRSAADVTGDAAWRIFVATPQELSLRADSTRRGQATTIRRPVDLGVLTEALAERDVNA